MIRTCNNCDIEKCNGTYNGVVGCKKHRNIVYMVPLRMLVSKVTLGAKDMAKVDNSSLIRLLQPY